jgi:protein tyrosine phosphatase (PTP) superfamily phosphohydrolase (DUF442 family)
MPLSAIKNFVQVTPSIASAGQPSEAQLAELASAKFDAVINLGLLDPAYCLPDEAGSVRELGLSYHHLPVHFNAPQAEDYAAFATVMEGLRERRVLVHCAMNYRASVFLALYTEFQLGWSREQADALITQLWTPNDVWSTFLSEQRQAPR